MQDVCKLNQPSQHQASFPQCPVPHQGCDLHTMYLSHVLLNFWRESSPESNPSCHGFYPFPNNDTQYLSEVLLSCLVQPEILKTFSISLVILSPTNTVKFTVSDSSPGPVEDPSCSRVPRLL
ncbi:unnamed protein product [Lepidochelys olivacea]